MEMIQQDIFRRDIITVKFKYGEFKEYHGTGNNMEDITLITSLKDCAEKKDIHVGSRLHAHILKRGLLQNSPYLASTLISMYSRCGMNAKAQHVLEEIPYRDTISWNSLIVGYSQQGKSHEAFNCFEQMQCEGLLPDVVTFTCILKACGDIGNIEKGKQIHRVIVNKGTLKNDIVLGTVLVDMYVKCGLMPEARQVLEDLPVGDVIPWSILISGYAEQGQGYEALDCFEKMQKNGLSPDVVTFTCALKACSTVGALEKGEHIYNEIVNRGLLKKDIVLGTAVVDMYAKCGMLKKARQSLLELPIRDVVSWSALIAGYTEQGQCEEAFNCFDQMQNEGILPDVITFISLLKACGSTRAIDKGKQIHDEIVRRGFLGDNIILGNALVDMYAKCGMLTKAEDVLMELRLHHVVSWNALISGYAQCGQGYKALDLFERMRNESLFPDTITLVCVLKACGGKGAIDRGKQIHGCCGFLAEDILLGNALIDMYVKCGLCEKAGEVLQELVLRDVITWNTLTAGHVHRRKGIDALYCFERMQHESICPDVITFVCILKACGNAGMIAKGMQIHGRINGGFLAADILIGNALMGMYAGFNMLGRAKQVLKELPVRDVISWSALIAEYAQQGQGEKALIYFEEMQSEGLSPDGITFTSILKACGSIRAVETGEKIHKVILSMGFLDKDIVLGNALVDFYIKCGMPAKAHEVFHEIPSRNVASWNTIIAAHAQQGQGHEALNCFEKMLSEEQTPDEITIICILKACGSTGAVAKGKEIHDKLISSGLLEKHPMLGNALVDMYAKCGHIIPAREVHEELSVRDLTCWNALITGFSQQGQGREALSSLEQMQNDGLSPNGITFLSVLSACSHNGLVEESQMLFESMRTKYGLTPGVEHHNCLITALGCAGKFDHAMSVIKAMPSSDCPTVWVALLAACRKWGNLKLGILVFDQVIQLDDGCASAYILVAGLFASAGMQKDAEKVEIMRQRYYATPKMQGNASGDGQYSICDTRQP